MGKTIRIRLDQLGPLTEEEKAMIKRAAEMPIVYDEDCPELTTEQLKQFKRVREIRDLDRKREVVSIRLKRETINKARAFGPKYTAILARMVEYGLDHPEIIEKCL